MTVAALSMRKSPREIERIRAAGSALSAILEALQGRVQPGVTTASLDDAAARLIAAYGAEPALVGIENRQALDAYPACVCVSVNDEVVHGVPGDRVLRDGDVVSIDCGLRLNGYCADAARTFAVGRPDPASAALIAAADAALAAGLAAMRPCGRWREVGTAMQNCVEGRGFSVVRDFSGHGIGRELHEPPRAPAFRDELADGDFELSPGLTLAIEPVLTSGDGSVRFADGRRWTVITQDGSRAAHVEDTVVVTATGIENLTRGG